MEETSAIRNKRIAKNTLMLYIRTFIILIIGVYTSRIVLNVLGVEDYGTYNIVGGVVSMFTIFTGSIAAAISRFLTFELGTGDTEKLKRVFSTSINVQCIIAIAIFIIAEVLGLWFVNNELKIDPTRIEAAHWVFQCSLASFIIGLISTPYYASIIAHERMGIYAYIGLAESLLKLIIVFLLEEIPFDKLKLYSLLMVISPFSVFIVYKYYCSRNFTECRYKYTFDKSLFKNMFSFSIWETLTTWALVLRGQGSNILLNIFTGTTAINAASGIATTLTGIVNSFTGNFMTAFFPQITKNYAANKLDELTRLTYQGTKFSAYLLLIIAIPTIINLKYVLTIWLGIIPEHTETFIILILIFSFNEIFSKPLNTIILATGKIQKYQIFSGGAIMLALPLSYISLKLGAPPEAVYIANIATSILSLCIRLHFVSKHIPSWKSTIYIRTIYLKVLFIAVLSAVPPYIAYISMNDTFLRVITTSLLSTFFSCIFIYYLGCTVHERDFIKSKVFKVKSANTR